MSPKTKINMYSVPLEIYFFAEKNNKDIYLHESKRITANSYLKRVNYMFKRDLDDSGIKSLGLPDKNTLQSWKLDMVEFPKKFILTYTTSMPLNSEDKHTFHEWLADLGSGCNNPVEYYKIDYCPVIRLRK